MRAQTRFKALGSIAKLSTLFINNNNNTNDNNAEEVVVEDNEVNEGQEE